MTPMTIQATKTRAMKAGAMRARRARLLIAAALFSVVLAASALPAAPALAAEAVFPTASRIGLVPPTGFTASTSFPGFENADKSAFIRLVTLPGNAYAEIEKTMTDAALKKEGMAVEKRETLALPSGNAILVAVRQEARDNSQPQASPMRIHKSLLIAPIGGFTAMVSFEMSDTTPAPYSDAVIRAALSTLAIRSHVPDREQLMLVPFNVTDSAGLRLIRIAPGVAAQFTDGPKDEFDAPGQSFLIVAAATGGPDQAGDRERFARSVFGGLPLKEVRIVSAESMRLGGQPGHEIRARGKDPKSGTDVEVVQWLRFGTGAYLRILGFGPQDKWAETFMRFRTVRDGLQSR
ncbi:MAG TPA: hypothetical protein VNQ50_02990 [Xanthobacteraceae bacterium]|nr:hypothetical protein [Xanthobacteraceae bacterium]